MSIKYDGKRKVKPTHPGEILKEDFWYVIIKACLGLLKPHRLSRQTPHTFDSSCLFNILSTTSGFRDILGNCPILSHHLEALPTVLPTRQFPIGTSFIFIVILILLYLSRLNISILVLIKNGRIMPFILNYILT